MKETESVPHPAALTVEDIVTRARIGRSTVFGEIKEGRLKARKVGRRTVVLAEDFRAWLKGLPERATKSEAA